MTFHRILLLAACFFVGSSRAANFYLSPKGDDTRAGTSPQLAWSSLGKFNSLDLAAGDSLLLEGGGVYPGKLILTGEDAGSPTRPVVISSYGTGRAIIEAGAGSAVEVKNAGGVRVETLVLRGSDRHANRGSGVVFVNELPGGMKLAHVRIEKVEASGFGRDMNPQPLGVQHPTGAGIWVGGYPADGSKSGYRDVRIKDCDLHDNEYYGVLITGYYDEQATTYANKDVYVGHTRAFRNSGDPAYKDNHSGNGILFEDVDGGLIEWSQAYGNGFECNSGAGGPVGIWTALSNRITIQFNESFDNRTGNAPDGGGFDFDGGVTNSVMQYNYSHGNDGAGFLLYTWSGFPRPFHRNVVRFNISENDGRKNRYAGIYCENGGNGLMDTEIYNNTVFMSPSDSGNPKAMILRGTTRFSVRNNIFVSTGGAPLVEAGPQEGLVFHGNAYWSTGAFTLQWNDRDYRNLEDWRMASGLERMGGQPTGLQADPEFLRQGMGDVLGFPAQRGRFLSYRLGNASPLRNGGLDLLGLFAVDPGPVDFWGNALSSGEKLPIGAYRGDLSSSLDDTRRQNGAGQGRRMAAGSGGMFFRHPAIPGGQARNAQGRIAHLPSR